MSSLSVEAGADTDTIVVSLFEVRKTEASIAAWIDREHEFRFLAVQPYSMDGLKEAQLAVRYAVILFT